MRRGDAAQAPTRCPAGTPGALSVPAWVARMTRGHWYRLSGARPDLGLAPTPRGTRYLLDNDPAADPLLNPPRSLAERARRLLGRRPRAPWSGRVGLAAMTEAWNGAVLASRHGPAGAMLVFGGGHDDYYGSDVHAFDLDSRRWSRLLDGYTGGGAGDYGAGAFYSDGIYPDGSPLPPHTYGYVQYDPVGHTVLQLRANLELGPSVRAAPVPLMLDLDSRAWRRGPRHPRAVLNSGGWSAWDAGRRILWGNAGDDGGGNAFLGFCPDGDNPDGTRGRWGEMFPSKLPGAANHCAMAMDPLRDLLAVIVPRQDRVCVLDPAAPAVPARELRMVGDGPRLAEHAALEYAPALDAFVYCSAADGARPWALVAPAGGDHARLRTGRWRWQCLLAADAALDPVADAARGSTAAINPAHTYGRFRVASFGATDVAILVRHVDSPVYALRLS